MKHSEFHEGVEFRCGDSLWRCSDVGRRVVVAIKIDPAEVSSSKGGEEVVTRTLNREEAEREGWFNGPPYAGAEYVFDEYDMPGCELAS